MSLLVSIDAGLRHCGMAIFDSGVLVTAFLVRNPERTERGPKAWDAMAASVLEQYPLGADVLVIEGQQYDGRMQRNPPDVMEIVGVTERILAAFAGRVDRAYAPIPAEWKGSVPKEVSHARLMEKLTDEEAGNIEDAGALTHNVLDAVALGRAMLERKVAA